MLKEIQQDSVKQGNRRETFLHFQTQARNMIRNFSFYFIDKVIDSMRKSDD